MKGVKSNSFRILYHVLFQQITGIILQSLYLIMYINLYGHLNMFILKEII